MARVESIPKKLSVKEFERRKAIGLELRRQRERQKLSVGDAAIAAGVSHHTWERWEAGRTAIPLELVANITVALRKQFVPAIQDHLRAA